MLSHIPPVTHIEKIDPIKFFKNDSYGRFHKLDYPPYWVGFFIDHNVFAANDLKKITNEFEVECWRPYGYGLKEPHEETINGIKHRVFPAKKVDIPRFGSITWSHILNKALLSEIKNGKVILNIGVGHAWFHILLMLRFIPYMKRFGLVALHRSGGFRAMDYYRLKLWKKLFKFYYLIESRIDVLSLKFCDHYFVGSVVEIEYINKNKFNIPASFFMEGIDFKKYQQLTQGKKKELRKKLKLPTDKKLLIAYGNWRSNDYGYQHLLEIFRDIKRTTDGFDLELIMIGGNKNEDLYQAGIESGAIMIEKVEKNVFINYLEASDFFAQACFSWGFIHNGGFGTAMIEALACGLPVISGNIIHFPGTAEERSEIGLDMPDKNTLKKNIIFMKNNLDKYQNCRELAKKYYNIEETRMILVNKYRELALKYY